MFEPPSAWNLAGPVTLMIAAVAANSWLDGPDWALLPILAVGILLVHWRTKIEAEHAAEQMRSHFE